MERMDTYARALAAYCRTRDAATLADADDLARAFVADDVGPSRPRWRRCRSGSGHGPRWRPTSSCSRS